MEIAVYFDLLEFCIVQSQVICCYLVYVTYMFV